MHDPQSVEHGPHGNDVALELQLRVREAGGDADQLREVEDRHLEVLARLLLQLRLPGVEREVTERARRDHRVGPGLLRLLDRLDQLAERRLLARLDDREPAALDLRRVVDRLPAAGLDDLLERGRRIRVVVPQQLRRAQDLAAVEGRDLEALQPAVGDLLQRLVALAVGEQPEEVLHLDAAGVGLDADLDEVLVHALAQRLVDLELVVRLAQVERADVAHRHQRVRSGLLGVGEDARVQVEVVVRLRLVDVAGAAAGDRLELLQLVADLRCERLRRDVQLLRRERGEAALVVRDLLHGATPSSVSCSPGRYGFGNEPGPYGPRSAAAPPPSWCSIRESAFSPWTMPWAPLTPCSLTRSKSARASFWFAATCGGKGDGTLPFTARPIANFICLIDVTIPCVFGTSSVSRSQPVVFAETTNQLACFAPMSRSIPWRIASAPSFAIASRGSTPFGQRSCQK